METETAEHRWGERKRGTKSPYLLGGLLDELLDEHGWALARSIRGADEGGEGTMSGRCRAPPHRRTGRIETCRDQRLLTSPEEEARRPDARLPTSSVLLRSGIGDGEGGRPGTNETDDAGKARGWRDGVASGVLACWGGGSGEGEGGRSWRQRAVEDD